MDKNIEIRLTTTPDLKMAAIVITCNESMQIEDLKYALTQYLEVDTEEDLEQ